eukprot:scaffold123119_cov14-Tisochrysis_lutea.AAC.1
MPHWHAGGVKGIFGAVGRSDKHCRCCCYIAGCAAAPSAVSAVEGGASPAVFSSVGWFVRKEHWWCKGIRLVLRLLCAVPSLLAPLRPTGEKKGK